MKKNYGKTANIILLIVTLGFLITYPLSFNFWGKLLSSGFCAAMIGGVADWFGVTALFRKPLGVPFRTEILIKNREKIFDSMVYMIENELLTKENIKKKINEYSISGLLKNYMVEHGGKEDVSAIADKVLKDIIYKADLKVLGKSLEDITLKCISNIKIIPVLVSAYEWSSENGYISKIFSFLFTELESIVGSPAVRSMTVDLVDYLLDRLRDISKNESLGTKLQITSILIVVKLFGITSEKAADKIIEYAVNSLRDLKYPLSPKRLEFQHSVDGWISALEDDECRQQALEARLKNYAAGMGIGSYLEKYADSVRSKILKNSENGINLEHYIETLLEKILYNFQSSPSQQSYVDEVGKKALLVLVEDKHSEIGKAVKERLDRISDKDLIETLELKIGRDLQIIRINGSVVGGFVGILSFLVTYIVFGG